MIFFICRLYNKSRLILSSKSNFSHNNGFDHNKDDGDDPWDIINNFRSNFDNLSASNSTQLGQLKSVMEETRNLPEEIAQLEAELNITRAELQVTQLLVNERDANTTSSFLLNLHGKR